MRMNRQSTVHVEIETSALFLGWMGLLNCSMVWYCNLKGNNENVAKEEGKKRSLQL